MNLPEFAWKCNRVTFPLLWSRGLRSRACPKRRYRPKLSGSRRAARFAHVGSDLICVREFGVRHLRVGVPPSRLGEMLLGFGDWVPQLSGAESPRSMMEQSLAIEICQVSGSDSDGAWARHTLQRLEPIQKSRSPFHSPPTDQADCLVRTFK
jgi:hypothetical protein